MPPMSREINSLQFMSEKTDKSSARYHCTHSTHRVPTPLCEVSVIKAPHLRPVEQQIVDWQVHIAQRVIFPPALPLPCNLCMPQSLI